MHRKALTWLRKSDPVLDSVIARVGPCRLRPVTDGTNFDFVARSIVHQQLSTKAATTIFGRLSGLCRRGDLREGLARLSDAELRGAGLSRQKLASLRDLAERTSQGSLNTEDLSFLPDEEVIRELCQVKGVGIWTAQMFLMFRLGRPDVFPVTDLGIRKGVQVAWRLRKLPPPERVLKTGKPWAPYRTVASWYLWRVLELEPVAA